MDVFLIGLPEDRQIPFRLLVTHLSGTCSSPTSIPEEENLLQKYKWQLQQGKGDVHHNQQQVAVDPPPTQGLPQSSLHRVGGSARTWVRQGEKGRGWSDEEERLFLESLDLNGDPKNPIVVA